MVVVVARDTARQSDGEEVRFKCPGVCRAKQRDTRSVGRSSRTAKRLLFATCVGIGTAEVTEHGGVL